ncbi:unnamed protein product [Prorocentrum cordatum]|uniref:OTU domain-containing protein n=1 Tax=Prorocentrum cordatum TaxID=2364126 RepID=A0ABN9PD10_9DINO|nr:unnamed protein product [Polarella glacialis]
MAFRAASVLLLLASGQAAVTHTRFVCGQQTQIFTSTSADAAGTAEFSEITTEDGKCNMIQNANVASVKFCGPGKLTLSRMTCSEHHDYKAQIVEHSASGGVRQRFHGAGAEGLISELAYHLVCYWVAVSTGILAMAGWAIGWIASRAARWREVGRVQFFRIHFALRAGRARVRGARGLPSARHRQRHQLASYLVVMRRGGGWLQHHGLLGRYSAGLRRCARMGDPCGAHGEADKAHHLPPRAGEAVDTCAAGASTVQRAVKAVRSSCFCHVRRRSHPDVFPDTKRATEESVPRPAAARCRMAHCCSGAGYGIDPNSAGMDSVGGTPSASTSSAPSSDQGTGVDPHQSGDHACFSHHFGCGESDTKIDFMDAFWQHPGMRGGAPQDVEALCSALKNVLDQYASRPTSAAPTRSRRKSKRQESKARTVEELSSKLAKALEDGKKGGWTAEKLVTTISDIIGTTGGTQQQPQQLPPRTGPRQEQRQQHHQEGRGDRGKEATASKAKGKLPRLGGYAKGQVLSANGLRHLIDDGKLDRLQEAILVVACADEVQALRDLARSSGIKKSLGVVTREDPAIEGVTNQKKWLRIDTECGRSAPLEELYITPLKDTVPEIPAVEVPKAAGSVAAAPTKETETIRITLVKRYASDETWKASMMTSIHSLWDASGVTRTYGFRALEGGEERCRTCFATVQAGKVPSILKQSGQAGLFAERLVCNGGRSAVEWVTQDADEDDRVYLSRVLRQVGNDANGLAFRRGGQAPLGWRLPDGTVPRVPDRALPWEIKGTPVDWSSADVTGFLEQNGFAEIAMMRPRWGKKGWVVKAKAPSGTKEASAYTIADGTVIHIVRDIRRQEGMVSRQLSARPGGVNKDLQEKEQKRKDAERAVEPWKYAQAPPDDAEEDMPPQTAPGAGGGAEAGAPVQSELAQRVAAIGSKREAPAQGGKEKSRRSFPASAMGFKTWDLGGTGDCFYRAVAAMAAIEDGRDSQQIETRIKQLAAKMRAESTNYIRSHELWKDTWVADTLSNTTLDDGAVPTCWKEWVDATARENRWVDEHAAAALSARVGRRIVVFVHDGGGWVKGWVISPPEPTQATTNQSKLAKARKKALEQPPLPVLLMDSHYVAMRKKRPEDVWPMEWGEAPNTPYAPNKLRGAGSDTDVGSWCKESHSSSQQGRTCGDIYPAGSPGREGRSSNSGATQSPRASLWYATGIRASQDKPWRQAGTSPPAPPSSASEGGVTSWCKQSASSASGSGGGRRRLRGKQAGSWRTSRPMPSIQEEAARDSDLRDISPTQPFVPRGPPQDRGEEEEEEGRVFGPATRFEHAEEKRRLRNSRRRGTAALPPQLGFRQPKATSWRCPVAGCSFVATGIFEHGQEARHYPGGFAPRRREAGEWNYDLMMRQKARHRKREHPDVDRRVFTTMRDRPAILVPKTEEEIRQQLGLGAGAEIPLSLKSHRCSRCQKWFPEFESRPQCAISITAHNEAEHAAARLELGAKFKTTRRKQKDLDLQRAATGVVCEPATGQAKKQYAARMYAALPPDAKKRRVERAAELQRHRKSRAQQSAADGHDGAPDAEAGRSGLE